VRDEERDNLLRGYSAHWHYTPPKPIRWSDAQWARAAGICDEAVRLSQMRKPSPEEQAQINAENSTLLRARLEADAPHTSSIGLRRPSSSSELWDRTIRNANGEA
jgi:hypothetical protein